MKHTLILLSYACLLTASAAVPLRWTVETSRATPAQFEAYQGETLYFEADLQSAGKPLEMSGLAEFFWQTNGMGSAYWETTAAVNSNRLSAVFAPEMDVGARVYNCFIGVPGTIYHAAFQLRLRPSPGAEPNTLPLPVPVIDFAKVRVLNPPWESGGGGVNTNAVIDIIHKTVDGSAKMLPKYLWQKDFDDRYPEAAEEYYRSRGDGKVDGGCSAVRSGGYLYRNFDYPLDDRAEFVVKMSAGAGRFASVGVAQVGTNLTETFVTSGKPSPCYKWLPGATVDGINERGVVAEINVVDGTPPRRLGGDIHPLAAVRWALDNGISAAMVASNLAARIQFPAGWTQNFHWMIADERETWIVENGTASNVTAVAAKRVMTNFPILPDTYAGMGKERYDLLFGGENITNAWYTRAYLRTTNWVSEFKDAEEMEAAKSAWETYPRERLRGHGLWQTVNTSVYDITNRVLRVAVQETDDWYTFAVPSAGGTDEAKVREIAETVVAPVASSVAGLRSSKADRATTYTKAETDAKLDEKIEKQAPNDVPARFAWEGTRLVLYWSCDGAEREVLSFDANSGGIAIYGPPSGLTFRGGCENLESYIEEINYHISEKADVSMISHENETFSNEVAAVAETIVPPQSPKLRVFDRVLNCWWVGEIVNGVINWEVE